MSGIIWLASYPKSGNTWFRIFLTNLLRDRNEPASINDLEISTIASARCLFDENVGIEASDLTADEIDRLRPELYCHLADTVKDPLYMKIHDAFTEVAPGLPLIPAKATAKAIYIVRNPLDVTVSFAHHNGWSYDTAISRLADDQAIFNMKTDRMHDQLRQKLLSWSNHVLSWVDATPFPLCLLRYEDMKDSPLKNFTKVAQFIGLDRNEARIEKAIRFSDFDILKQQEKTEGFRELSPASSSFFRKGESGSWREELSKEQVTRVVSDHGAVMRRFGYLDERGEIVV